MNKEDIIKCLLKMKDISENARLLSFNVENDHKVGNLVDSKGIYTRWIDIICLDIDSLMKDITDVELFLSRKPTLQTCVERIYEMHLVFLRDGSRKNLQNRNPHRTAKPSHRECSLWIDPRDSATMLRVLFHAQGVFSWFKKSFPRFSRRSRRPRPPNSAFRASKRARR